jgi:hypothetical protein
MKFFGIKTLLSVTFRYLSAFTDFVEKEILGHRLDVEVSEMSVGVLINQTYYQDISNYLDAVST